MKFLRWELLRVDCPCTQGPRYYRARFHKADKRIQRQSILVSYETKRLSHRSSKLCIHLWFILTHIPYAQQSSGLIDFFSLCCVIYFHHFLLPYGHLPWLRPPSLAWCFCTTVFFLLSTLVSLSKRPDAHYIHAHMHRALSTEPWKYFQSQFIIFVNTNFRIFSISKSICGSISHWMWHVIFVILGFQNEVSSSSSKFNSLPKSFPSAFPSLFPELLRGSLFQSYHSMKNLFSFPPLWLFSQHSFSLNVIQVLSAYQYDFGKVLFLCYICNPG